MSNTTDFLFLQWAPTLIGGLFVFLFGACVGSFLNVLAWRLPTGQSVVTPPSRCPICGHRLGWRENLPILGWFLLRGRCKACKQSISCQYPIVELLVALLFLAAFIALYAPLDRSSGLFFDDAASPWWRAQGFGASWPAFVLVVLTISGLVAMTIVDAKTMLIPVEIPTGVTLIAFVGWFVQGFLPEAKNLRDFMPIPVASTALVCAAVGLFLGLGVSRFLLRTGRLRHGFSDWSEFVKEGDDPGIYPHARREMFVELAFLLPGIVGAVAGWMIAGWLVTAPQTASDTAFCAPWTLLGGSLVGWVVGGALVWGVRILGSLAFGREAMGLGDVHLQAAVGAAFGWKVALLAFFVAVFVAIAWALLSLLLRRFSTFFRREIPFGPHLAAGAILFIVARGPVVRTMDAFARGLEQAVELVAGPLPERLEEPDGKTRRMPPAELARPTDRR